MTRSMFERVAGRWLAALLALAATSVVGASTARAAGCAGHAPRHASAAVLDVSEWLEIIDDLSDDSHSTPSDAPSPCAGGSCSKLPVSPSPTAPEADSGGDRWAAASPLLRSTAPGAVARPQNEPVLRSIVQADPIFHPPRRPARHDSP